jgi:hypothetical protein
MDASDLKRSAAAAERMTNRKLFAKIVLSL